MHKKPTHLRRAETRQSSSASQPTAPPDTAAPADGSAAIYLLELYNLRDKGRFGRPTLRAGVDGKWVGATQGLSYVRTIVQPGEHHLCVRWQSHFERLSQEISLYNFTAAPGATYYFRTSIVQDGGENGSGPILLDLEPVSTDEGRFLVSEARPAVSKVK